MGEHKYAMSDWEATDWSLIYRDWNPRQQPTREALCTLGNGSFATRGAAEESKAGGAHYPGTYLAGGYDRLDTEIAGRVIENEDLVNWPNWLCLNFRPANGAWFDLDSVEVLSFRQELDVRRGILEREVHFRDGEGHETTLLSRRLVHMSQPHLAAIEWVITPENWSGPIEISTGLDGTVTNAGVKRYRELNGRHLEPLETGRVGEDGLFLLVRTVQSKLRMAEAARTRVFCGEWPAPVERRTVADPAQIAQEIFVDCKRSQSLRIEKVVAVYSSRDNAISEPGIAARSAIVRAPDFQELLTTHSRAWRHLWDRCDIEFLDHNHHARLVLRLHIFHLLQTASMNSVDLDVGVPARGLHGEAYRGHIFWDELFIFPFLNLRIPELTRALLMYRYRRLGAARYAAKTAGYEGAMFPWQSGSDGREESQVVHLNPRSERWIPDNTYRQRHVNAAIAFNVWQYFQATEDAEFLSFYGAEMILEIARFWASVCVFNNDRERYEIHGVVGPDEFHTAYPDSEEPGLNNNAYTNVLAAWVLRCAGKALQQVNEERRGELLEDLQIGDEELARWEEISRKMFVPFHDGGIISQFEGYENLEEFDFAGYRKKYGDIQRLDRILESEGKDPDRYQAGKQADVLMLFYLFSSDELTELLESMGYEFDPQLIPTNVDYYLRRSSHGSTLSRVVDSWVLARSDRERSWNLFCEALNSDVADIQGGTTSEGIHLGAMAGAVDVIQRCYTGIEVREDVLWLNPSLPDEVRQIRLRIRYRGRWLQLEANHEQLRVSLEKGVPHCAKIGFRDEVHIVDQGDAKVFDLTTGECVEAAAATGTA